MQKSGRVFWSLAQALAANLAIAAVYISAEAPIRSRVIMFEIDIGRVISSFGVVWVKRTELSLLLKENHSRSSFYTVCW